MEKLSSNQVEPGQAIKSAVTQFPSISCATCCPVTLYSQTFHFASDMRKYFLEHFTPQNNTRIITKICKHFIVVHLKPCPIISFAILISNEYFFIYATSSDKPSNITFFSCFALHLLCPLHITYLCLALIYPHFFPHLQYNWVVVNPSKLIVHYLAGKGWAGIIKKLCYVVRYSCMHIRNCHESFLCLLRHLKLVL